MAKPRDESISDGLEIVSIGKLYAGPWDKKYWSSSRGKDRYPYPIGYQALRTHNGVTYKMEVHEGTKGPTFQISSNNKQSDSGETPDRVWANFQKKYCSRVKIWPGKRFSGKVDGVEFFGFKNALVQRLLRELVATLNDASDQSSLTATFMKPSAKGRDAEHPKTESPELMSFLGKTGVTGKRSRISRGVDSKSACKRSHKVSESLIEAEDPCREGRANDDALMISTTSSRCDINQTDGTSQLESDMVLEKNVPLSGDCLPVNSTEVSDASIVKSFLADWQSELISMEKYSSASVAVLDRPEEGKPLDRQCTKVLGHGLSAVTEEENEKPQITPDVLDSRPPVLMDSQVNHSAEHCVPDTFDTHQDIGDGGGEKATSMTELVADTAFSEEPITGSHSEDRSSHLTGSSEKSDFDPDEDIAKSMLAILLPRATPLLTYSSRKKKRKPRPSKELACEIKCEELDGAIPCSNVISPVSTHAKLGMEGVKEAPPPNVNVDQPGLALENIKFIVPDSLDDYQSENLTANKLQQSSINVDNVSVNFQEKCDPCEIFDSLNTTELLYHNIYDSHNKTGEFIKVLSHDKSAKGGHMRAQKDGVLGTVGCESLIPMNPFVEGQNLPSLEEANCLSREQSLKNIEMESILEGQGIPKKEEYSVPLSEIIICRNDGDICLPKMDHGAEILVPSESCSFSECSNGDRSKTSSGVQGKCERQSSYTIDDDAEEALAQNNSLPVLQECTLPGSSHIKEGIAATGVNCLAGQKSYEEIEGSMKLVGCYNHPMQISSVKLTEIGHEIYVCVSCGSSLDGERDLFLYKLLCKQPSSGSPCMIGHTSMRLPLLKDEFGREVVIDKSGLQFTPDARALVLIDSIRMPYCREKSLHCSCPQCESCCFEENAVKIVQMQCGYALVILKLYTVYAIHCILICEPKFLIAVDESGRIYIWIMDATWSKQVEEHIILSYDFLPSRIVELKRVPKSASMVLGHNGYGQFSVWDITKRTMVTQFSAPASSFLDYHPVSSFRWQNKCLSRDESHLEESIKNLVEESTPWLSGHNNNDILCTTDWKDIALWLLMYTFSNSNVPSAGPSSNCHSNSDECWRLALLAKTKVIMGAALPTSTAAIGSSSGLGIIGTYNGDVDIWELATGKQLGSLHHHAGKRVSHVAVDDASSSVVAIAHDDGQLWVYHNH